MAICSRKDGNWRYPAQIGLEIARDILFGTPIPHEINVDLGIMDPDYVKRS